MFLIRLASLLPEAVNLRQTGRDVEQVAKMLSEGKLSRPYTWSKLLTTPQYLAFNTLISFEM